MDEKTESQKNTEQAVKPTASDVQTGLEILHREYLMNVVALLSHDESIKELSYVKVPLVTEEGGTYLVSVLHIDGPKMDMDAFRQKVAVQENKKPQDG